jgi:methionyl-tRNA synthetase
MEKRKWIVTSAWPYVNATPHLGNLIGSVLSADVFARYVRAKGDDVVFVSGSDEHGTPVAVSAMEQNMTPEQLTQINHAKIKKLFEDWLISYDNYTHTHNPVHIKFTQDFYEQVNKNGFVSTQDEDAFYCPKDDLFLPDRFIEGTCPKCGSELARGDQCDKCGQLLTPEELISPHCRHCKSVPIQKKTKHWYFDFAQVQDNIREFVTNNPYIPDNARTASLNSIKEGLPKRAITRDLKWGIPATFPGAENKSIYVWFEAVLGYISAVKQWADEMIKEPSKFDYFWRDQNTRTVYFIGKDNIIFHLIIFPGLLFGYNANLPIEQQFVYPYNVSSTEFLMYENDKFSKSRGVGIWIDEALQLAPVEYWRYSLLRNRPEKSDTSFLWVQFEKDVLEINDIIGNFIHRVLTFIYTKYDATVPAAPNPDQMDDLDKKLIGIIEAAPKRIGELMEIFKLKDALNEIVLIAREGNTYINDKAPWKLIKQDKEKAGHIFYLSIQMVRCLGILLSPFIPNIADQIIAAIGSTEKVNDGLWDSAGQLLVPVGQKIPPPVPLLKKIDVKQIQEELFKLHGGSLTGNTKPKDKDAEIKPEISYDQFKKIELRVGTIIDAEPVDGANNLLKLMIDIGEKEPRTLVAGIAKTYKPDDVVGTQIIMVANLDQKEIRGIISNGMLLAADTKKKGPILLRPDSTAPNGSPIH